MVKKFSLTVSFMLGVILTPGLLIAASEVVIGYANISARVSPLWIAQEKGFFAKFGVNVQQVYMPGSPVMIASMASGQVHLANTGGTAAFGAAAGGLDLRVIGTFTSHIPFDLVVRPNIKSPKDLRGKRIGVQVVGGPSGWRRCSAWNTSDLIRVATTSRSSLPVIKRCSAKHWRREASTRPSSMALSATI